MRSAILALLAPAAVALSISVSEAAPVIQVSKTEAGSALTVYVYRAVRGTTVRGPHGGVYHSRTAVAGHRGPYGGAYVARRGVYAHGGGHYGPHGAYASRGVYARRGY